MYGSDSSVGPANVATALSSTHFCPQLAMAADAAADALQSAVQLPEVSYAGSWQFSWQQGQAEAMRDAAVVLRLALAVAAMWPYGILTSSTAYCLAGGQFPARGKVVWVMV
jgi:hypothetical protein